MTIARSASEEGSPPPPRRRSPPTRHLRERGPVSVRAQAGMENPAFRLYIDQSDGTDGELSGCRGRIGYREQAVLRARAPDFRKAVDLQRGRERRRVPNDRDHAALDIEGERKGTVEPHRPECHDNRAVGAGRHALAFGAPLISLKLLCRRARGGVRDQRQSSQLRQSGTAPVSFRSLHVASQRAIAPHLLSRKPGLRDTVSGTSAVRGLPVRKPAIGAVLDGLGRNLQLDTRMACISNRRRSAIETLLRDTIMVAEHG